MYHPKIALVFPGQGSQFVGMCKDLYDEYELARDIFDRANELLGYDLSEKCFKKPALGKKIMHWTDLDKTIYTQPAVLTASYACFKAFDARLRELGITCDIFSVAGHSLGEYTALLVAGALDFETTLELVVKRATYMTEWGKAYPESGLMAIVDRKEELDYNALCSTCKDYGVNITLNNTKHQIVVGGSKRRLGELAKELKKQGKRTTLLRVEGPFHTPIMRPAAEKFKKELQDNRFHIASIPIIANMSTHAIVDPEHIRKELYQQIFNIVNWRGTIEKLIDNEVDLFIELGPKNILSNMIRNIDPSITTLNVEDTESLETTLKELSGEGGIS